LHFSSTRPSERLAPSRENPTSLIDGMLGAYLGPSNETEISQRLSAVGALSSCSMTKSFLKHTVDALFAKKRA
jgi:hypothetical protein